MPLEWIVSEEILEGGIQLTHCLDALEDANARLVEASRDLANVKRELKACRHELKLVREQFAYSGPHGDSYTTAMPSGTGLQRYFRRKRVD